MRGPASRSLNVRLLGRTFAALAVLSAVFMIKAAAASRADLATAAAAAFAVGAVLVAVLSNIEAWRCPSSGDAAGDALLASGRLRQNTWLAAIAYLWGAVAMQGLYLTPLTGLKWQHGWQYALAMLLLAAGSLAFERTLLSAVPGQDPRGWGRHFRLALPLASGQALVAGGGLAVMALSGKLRSVRADWAANRVFAALAVAILAIAVCSLVSHRRLVPASGRT